MITQRKEVFTIALRSIEPKRKDAVTTEKREEGVEVVSVS